MYMVFRILIPAYVKKYPLDNRESAQNLSFGFVRFAIFRHDFTKAPAVFRSGEEDRYRASVHPGRLHPVSHRYSGCVFGPYSC